MAEELVNLRKAWVPFSMNFYSPKNEGNLTLFVDKFVISISGSMEIEPVYHPHRYPLLVEWNNTEANTRLILSNQPTCSNSFFSLTATPPSPPHNELGPRLLPLPYLTKWPKLVDSTLAIPCASSPLHWVVSPTLQISLVRMVSAASPLPTLLPAFATSLHGSKAHSASHTSLPFLPILATSSLSPLLPLHSLLLTKMSPNIDKYPWWVGVTELPLVENHCFITS